MKKLILAAFLVVVTGEAYTQHSHGSHGNEAKSSPNQMTPMFKSQEMGEAYERYTALKDALVESDALKSSDAAAQLVIALQDLKNASKTFEMARMVANAETIEDQREMFVKLSKEMVSVIKSSKLTMGTIYVDYCPMANNNEGAYWLSNDVKITNPYFGEEMLTCGSVIETIE